MPDEVDIDLVAWLSVLRNDNDEGLNNQEKEYEYKNFAQRMVELGNCPV